MSKCRKKARMRVQYIDINPHVLFPEQIEMEVPPPFSPNYPELILISEYEKAIDDEIELKKIEGSKRIPIVDVNSNDRNV